MFYHSRGDGREMPYEQTEELPARVKLNLPLHAQEIYLAAFDNAWKEYADPEKRHGEESREETAHRVAWAAVKRRYRKNPRTGKWEEKTAG
jgi:cation transport regulator